MCEQNNAAEKNLYRPNAKDLGPHAQPQPRTVDQVVRRLRKVLAAIGLPDLVRAQRGLGYQLDLPSTRSPAPFPSL